MGKARKVAKKAAKGAKQVLGLDGREVPAISQKVYGELVNASEGILSREQVDNMLRLRTTDGLAPKLKSPDGYLDSLYRSLFAQNDVLHGVKFLEGGENKFRIAGRLSDHPDGSISSVLQNIKKHPEDFKEISEAVDFIGSDDITLEQAKDLIWKNNTLLSEYGDEVVRAVDEIKHPIVRKNGLTEEEWRQKYGSTVEFGDLQGAQESEAALDKRLDQEAEDWGKLGKQHKTAESTDEEMLDWSAQKEHDIDSYGEAVRAAEAQQKIDNYYDAKNTARLMNSPEAKEARARLDASRQQAQEQAEEQAKIDSMTPEQQQAYFAEKGKKQQEQREAEAATRAGQRKAARTLEEPNGLSYIGAYGPVGKDGALGYSGVYFDKDDLVSMLMKKHSESMGIKGAVEHMTNNIQRDLDKGYQRIMSSNSKNKKEEIDNLIGELASRIDIDDGPGLRDYIMGNKLHTGAIGFAAMAGTMGIAFGGHKSNAELYSSPF